MNWKRPKISVIITTKNEAGVIGNLLASLKSQSFQDFEVILVDNNSRDETKKIAEDFGAKVFNYGPERSVQRNFGVKKAKGESVLILDADMELTENVLSDLAKIKDKVATVPEKSFGVGFWSKVRVFEREFYLGEPTIEAPRYFKRETFLKFGGYDERLTGPEDYDLPYRMRKSGVKAGRIQNFILHNEKKFSPLKSAQKKFYYAAHSRGYLKKHPELTLSQGNLIFRPLFFKKWKKLVSHPGLSLAMFSLKMLEMLGALGGILYSGIMQKNE